MISTYDKPIPSIPKETARAASASFGRGNFYIQVGEQLDNILGELHWQQSHAQNGGFAMAEDLSLALITLFQFIEGLTDAQASDAMRTRIDWKFALHLSLLPRTLDAVALCRFRERILSHAIEQQGYQVLIDGLVRSVPLLNNRIGLPGSLEIVSLVCSVNRLNQVQQAMNRVLEVLASRFPQWLRAITLPHWYGRYNPSLTRFDGSVLPSQQRLLMEEIASDIHHLLEKVDQAGSREICELCEVKVLNQVWSHLFQAASQAQKNRLETLSIRDCDLCFHEGAGGRHHTGTNH
ncbi:MAG: transposase [Chloroflexota bacterium]